MFDKNASMGDSKRRGILHRIYLHNFGTYSEVEMFPGQNLNLILGPNGTGKSTLLSAIVLGLGGHPKVIGRSSQLKDYIKRNCTEAFIEIEIESGDESPNLVISRKFNDSNHTTWKINNKNATVKEVTDLIAQYHIQINNLCQFLPQDRVQDFAKMNNRELLINTEKSVGPVELSEQHEQLIHLRSQHRELEAKVEKSNAVIKEAEQKNNRISSTVKNIKERKTLVTSLNHAKGKLAWINYDNKRNKVEETKADKEQAEKQVKQYEEELKPLEGELNGARNKVKVEQSFIIDKNRLVSQTASKLREQIESSEELITSINSVENEIEQKIQQEQARQKSIDEAKAKVEKLENDLSSLVERYGTEDAINEEMRSFQPKIARFDDEIEKLNIKKSTQDYKLETINREIAHYQHEKQMLENVSKQRLELLRKIDVDVYRSVLWLRENRHLFHGNVYEPILLEINVTNPAHAKYIENIISIRDLCIFVCEEVTDMNLLLENLRVGQKLRVSVAHSGAQHPPSSSYAPPVPIDQIRQFGFFAYANTLITGPEAIMKYLCRSCRIHSIPIGNALTNDVYERIPSQVRVFFSDSKRFAVSVSQYTSEKSTSIEEIRSRGLLSVSLNLEGLAALSKKINEFETEKNQMQRQISAIENQIRDTVEMRNSLITRRKELHSNIEQVKNIKARLKVAIQNVNHLEQTVFDIDQIKQECQQKIEKYISDLFEMQRKIIALLQKYQSHLTDTNLSRAKLELYQKQVSDIIKKQQEIQQHYMSFKDTLNNIISRLQTLRTEAKQEYEKAKSLTDGLTPDSKEFDKFNKIFNKLPDNEDTLTDYINDIQVKLDCMFNVDEGIVREYEDRLKQIDQHTKDKERIAQQLEEVLQDIQSLKHKWLTPLTDFVDRINDNFEQYFARMGCTGEVSIVQADNELDFDQYGLSIKVSYRTGEPLQELDQYVQSGGERAVATAIYMLSLQELTYVPFRCVDEINQGMDALNERKVFELIIKSTTEPNTPQYFLLTPKLLPNLTYSKTTTVHIIHNGPYEVKGDQYNTKKLVEELKNSSSSSQELFSSSFQ